MAIEEELAEIVGKENVFSEPNVLQKYAKDHSFVREVMPQCVVEPKNTEDIQRIVQWAGQKSIPLIPVSSGEPHFRGDTVPSLGGVILDLSGMDKIVRIDRRNRVAMIEPGITFTQLVPELKKEGLRVPTPLYPRSSKSVIGSYLEREPTIIPKYHIDTSEPMLCTEVIFGTGDKFMTGEAAGPGTVEEQQRFGKVQKFGAGPGQVGFLKLLQATQGSIGIVTWATLRCEVLPKARKLLFVPIQQIDQMVDFMYRILRLRLGDECLLLNNLDLASILSLNGASIESLRRTLPPWILLLGIAGYESFPDERVKYQEEDIMDIARQFGLVPVSEISGIRGEEVLNLLDMPSPEPYWKLRYKGDCYDIFFLTTLDKVPHFISVLLQVAEAHQYPAADIGIYIQPIQQGRSCHCEFGLTCDPSDEREVAKVSKFFLAASESLMKEGAFFSRPYGPWAGMVYNRDAVSRESMRKVKNIFDPRDILNPGKLY